MEAFPEKNLSIQAKLMLPLAITILLPLAVSLPLANNLINSRIERRKYHATLSC